MGGVRCVEGVEECVGRGGGMWKGWGVWQEGWRCVEGVEECDGRGGGVWEG